LLPTGPQLLGATSTDFRRPFHFHWTGVGFFTGCKITLTGYLRKSMTPTLLKLGGLSRVTGVRMPTLLRWWDRNTIESGVTTSGSGEYRRCDLATINRVAIAAKLMPLGVAAGPSLKAAAHFTDFGDGKRAANELFEFGRTILIHTEAGTKIKNLDADVSISDAFGRPMTPAIILDIGPVIHEVDQNIQKELKR
jgi:hypothetical protein